MAVIAKPSARMPTYIGLLRLPVTSLFEMKVPTRRMSSVPVAIRGRSAVIVRYSGTISRMQRLPAFGGCAQPAPRGQQRVVRAEEQPVRAAEVDDRPVRRRGEQERPGGGVEPEPAAQLGHLRHVRV